MAQWKETLEPYVKVIESVKTASLNPSAGGDLILGAVLISDSGPAEPTLITSQRQFLEVYAAEELTKDYVKSLDSLYTSDPGSSLASTMWLNAYRLAGSASLLVSRASRANDIIYTQPLNEDNNDYILKDSEILKSVPSFKFVIDKEGSKRNGWAVAVNEIGIIGNLVDDDGPRYDYKVNNLVELVNQLNETNKFYSPSYKFYLNEKCSEGSEWTESSGVDPIAVKFDEVYLAPNFLDQTVLTLDNEQWESDGNEDTIVTTPAPVNPDEPIITTTTPTPEESTTTTTPSNTEESTTTPTPPIDVTTTPTPPIPSLKKVSHGLAYIFAAEPEWEWAETEAINKVQSLIDLNDDSYSRFSPFSHYACNLYNTRSELTIRIRRFNHAAVVAKTSTNEKESPWKVDERVLGTNPSVTQDFYEFGIKDPSISPDMVLFNVGNLPGRGDITLGELAESLSMIYLKLPENLEDLGLDYYSDDDEKPVQYSVTLSIKEDSALLQVSDADIKAAWDRIEDDERYVVEGFADLGCTYTGIQNYIANIAVNSNYFYAFSLANTTNYMTIANSASKMAVKSHKLYAAAPWDYDDGTVGFQFAVSPSTIYWETVLRNRRNNNEFAGVFGQNAGRVSVMNLAKDFKKSERQLLLTKKINTIGYDNYLGIYHFNDNYTFTEESFVMSEECNSRLQIRISKAMPLLLNQFKGRQNTAKTWKEIREVVNYWFNNTILRYNYTVAEYRVICDETNNTAESIRQNKVFVKVQVRFNSSIKYITVYNDAYPIGVDFEE